MISYDDVMRLDAAQPLGDVIPQASCSSMGGSAQVSCWKQDLMTGATALLAAVSGYQQQLDAIKPLLQSDYGSIATVSSVQSQLDRARMTGTDIQGKAQAIQLGGGSFDYNGMRSSIDSAAASLTPISSQIASLTGAARKVQDTQSAAAVADQARRDAQASVAAQTQRDADAAAAKLKADADAQAARDAALAVAQGNASAAAAKSAEEQRNAAIESARLSAEAQKEGELARIQAEASARDSEAQARRDAAQFAADAEIRRAELAAELEMSRQQATSDAADRQVELQLTLEQMRQEGMNRQQILSLFAGSLPSLPPEIVGAAIAKALGIDYAGSGSTTYGEGPNGEAEGWPEEGVFGLEGLGADLYVEELRKQAAMLRQQGNAGVAKELETEADRLEVARNDVRAASGIPTTAKGTSSTGMPTWAKVALGAAGLFGLAWGAKKLGLIGRQSNPRKRKKARARRS